MLRSIKSLTGYTISAKDGEIGKVDEFYFDDQTGTVRYMIVKTGNWLSGRKVLISTAALGTPDWNTQTFPVDLTVEQIRNSPDIDTDKPVSRQQEVDLNHYYNWPYYGAGGYYIGASMWGIIHPPVADGTGAMQGEGDVTQKSDNDPHLRSTREVIGYDVQAIDGEVGEVEDFIIDDTKWSIHFLVVDTGNLLPGKKVLISPQWVRSVVWEDSTVHVDLEVEAIRNSPEFDPSEPVNEKYELNLYDYYGRPVHHV